jgi:hypothetical protein
MPFEVRSRWWSGAGEVSTFALEELMATKLRALYQRRKGRDLFDLWYVLSTLQADDEQIVQTMTRYMGTDTFSFPELRTNLRDKPRHPDFLDDLDTLLVRKPAGYNLPAAADLLMERLGPHLKNAPHAAEIAHGVWRG